MNAIVGRNLARDSSAVTDFPSWWAESEATGCAGHRDANDPLPGRAMIVSLGDIVIIHGPADPAGVKRALHQLQQSGCLRAALTCVMGGRSKPAHGPRDGRLAGGAVLHMQTSHHDATLVVAVPLSQLSLLTCYAEELVAQSEGGATEINDLICAYVDSFLIGVMRDRPDSIHAVEATLGKQLGMLVVNSLENGQSRRGSISTVAVMKLHNRALGFIRENICDPTLSPAVVAHACGISASYLHKLFSAAGTTVGRVVLDMRLNLCRERLSEHRHAHTPISSIAYDLGFNNPAHFSTRFRDRFGMSPREFRMQAGGGA